MELIFETSDGGINDQFTMEVSNSDSVSEIKQKIQQLKGIPISTQTLLFNGAVLADDFNLRHSQIVDASTIHLRQHIERPSSSRLDQNEDLRQELDRICALLPSPPNTLIQPHAAATAILSPFPIRAANVENSTTRSSILAPFPIRVGAFLRQSGKQTDDIAGVSNRDRGGIIGKRVRKKSSGARPMLMVVVGYGGQHSMVMVRPEERVSALRGKLQQIQWRLPPRYEFIHNHRVMDETRSFAFSHVLQGDVIQASPRSP